MSTDASEMVTIPRAEWESVKAELRRLQLADGNRIALAALKADPGPGPNDTALVLTREQLLDAAARGARA